MTLQDKIHLKPLDINNPDQLGFMFRVRCNPDIDKHLTGNAPKTYFEHVNYLSNVADNKYFHIIYYDDDFAGYCQTTMNKETFEVGWALCPTKIGRGIGAVAVKLLLEFCKKLANKKIILYVKEDNVRAISLYRKFNFIEKENNNGIILMELHND